MPKANFTARLEAGNIIVTEFPQHVTALDWEYASELARRQ